jgi:ribonucleoside-diphosphate reductase alpha chain
MEDSPYWGATSPEIDWKQRVKLQAAAQRWIDHGISSTCNLPSDVSVDTVKEIYEEAWKSGCKGFTVYRDGSRDGILVSTEKPTREKARKRFDEHHAPRRPKELECKIHNATIKGEEWTILVGLLDGRPYEVMGGLSEYVEIPKKYKEGRLIKRSRKTMLSIYDLAFGENGDEVKIKDVVKVFDNPDHSAFTRTISLALRHGAPIQYIVEQLQKDKDADLFSFSKVISRVLKNYIKDGSKPGSNRCHECGSLGSLVYQEGCVRCESCGTSKCG